MMELDYTALICVFATIATNLTTVIILYCHQDNKTTSFLKAIQDEMKDFHGRLERQDAEFKAKLEKHDAEFKSHLLYAHQMKTVKE